MSTEFKVEVPLSSRLIQHSLMLYCKRILDWYRVERLVLTDHRLVSQVRAAGDALAAGGGRVAPNGVATRGLRVGVPAPPPGALLPRGDGPAPLWRLSVQRRFRYDALYRVSTELFGFPPPRSPGQHLGRQLHQR